MSGYSEGGASLSKKTLKMWQPQSFSAKSDAEYNLKLLRNRSRDLARNSALGAAIINCFVSNVIGSGLQVFPRLEAQYLGITPDNARALSKTIKREFNLWSEECDYLRRNNFTELQTITFTSMLIDGDCFVLMKRREPTPYSLRLQVVESGRVSNPGGDLPEVMYKGNRVVNGIEVDEEGALTACHVSNRLWNEPDALGGHLEWQRVEFFGKETGYRNVLQICQDNRAEQYRGVPLLAPVIESLKQVARFCDSELTSSIIKSFFSVFFVQPAGNFTLNEITGEELDISEYQLGAGTISALPRGVDVKAISSDRMQDVFDSFVSHFLKQIGAAVGLPYEVLMKNFQSSYSASRAALLQAASEFERLKVQFIRDFCQVVYEQFLMEAVALGRIDAPGFFEDKLKRQSYSKAQWYSRVSRVLDVQRETAASIMRLQNGLTSYERELAESSGEDFEEIIERLSQERALLSKEK